MSSICTICTWFSSNSDGIIPVITGINCLVYSLLLYLHLESLRVDWCRSFVVTKRIDMKLQPKKNAFATVSSWTLEHVA